MFFTILIGVVALLSILLFIKSKRDPLKQAPVPFEETHPKGEFRVLQVMDMSDEKVQETIQFIEDIAEGTSSQIPTPTIERNGNIVMLKLNAKLNLIDFATWVNNFIFADPKGQPYQVHGFYPIATAMLGGKEINNSTLTFYTPEILNSGDESRAYFKTQKGKEYCYDLGYHEIHKVTKKEENS
jgi:hypothetical protein